MSDEAETLNQNQELDTQTENPGVTEFDLLKTRAKMLGITFSNNISLETLKLKVADKMSGESSSTTPDEEAHPNPLADAADLMDLENQDKPVQAKPMTLRQKVYSEQMALVRCRITNMDPKKKDLPGEVITVGNEYLGTVSKFIPFGEHSENGYHLPICLYNFLKARKFLNIRTIKDKRTGIDRVSHTWASEFAIEVMDPLTTEELAQLAQAQIAAGSIDQGEA